MALKRFDFAAVPNMSGGRMSAVVNREIQRVVDDCMDRPDVTKTRKVVITLEVTPEAAENGELSSCAVGWTVDHKLPPLRARNTHMIPAGKGLAYSEFSEEDARQLTLDEASRPRAIDGRADTPEAAAAAAGGS